MSRVESQRANAEPTGRGDSTDSEKLQDSAPTPPSFEGSPRRPPSVLALTAA